MTAVVRRYGEERRGLLTVLLVLLIVNLVFYVVLTLPSTLRARDSQNEVGSTREGLARVLDAYAGTLREVTALDDARSVIDSLYRDTLRSNATRYPLIDAKIKELQTRFGLAPQSVNYGYTDRPREGLQQLAISFRLKGSYTTLRDFVSQIEQATDPEGRDLFFSIERIGLADSGDTGRELNLDISVVTQFDEPSVRQTPGSSNRPKVPRP